MTAHGSFHHKRAAKARKSIKVKALEERFSPTAIFPEMTEIPDATDLFPGIEHHGHGHHLKTPEISDFTDFTDFTDPTTPIIPNIPAIVTTPVMTTRIPSTTSSFIVLPTSTSASTISSTISSTSSSIVSTRIALETTTSQPISSAVPSASDSSGSGVSTGAIVGGVGAGIVAVAVVGFAVAFLIRRVRKRELDNATSFDARDFRRSAVMLPDPPTHENTVNHGYNLPPPPMVQQNRQTPISAPAWGYADPYYEPSHGMPYQNASGRALSSTTSAQTFVTAAAQHFEPNPIVPVSLPSPYGQSTANSPVLTRQPSNNSTERQTLAQSKPTAVAPYPDLTHQPMMRSAQIPPDDYVDLSRSSVSPFQAAQYAEISRCLNHPPVPSEPSPGMVSPARIYATQQKDLPPIPHALPTHEASSTYAAASIAVSPFGGPEPSSPLSPQSVQTTESVTAHVTASELVSPPSPAASATPAIAIETLSPLPSATLNVQTLHLPALSADSISQEELEFPIPPSPTVSYSSRYRTDSLPPVLPEIQIQQRSSVSSYIPGSPMIGSGYISGLTDTSGMSGFSGVPSMGLQPIELKLEGRFVPVPSPLASSFTAPTPVMEHEGRFAEAQASTLKDNIHTASAETSVKAAGSFTASAESRTAALKRPDTVYDPEDAYGGF